MMHDEFMMGHVANYLRFRWTKVSGVWEKEEDTYETRHLWFKMYCMGGEL